MSEIIRISNDIKERIETWKNERIKTEEGILEIIKLEMDEPEETKNRYIRQSEIKIQNYKTMTDKQAIEEMTSFAIWALEKQKN